MRGKRYFIYSLFLVILIPTFFMFLMNSGCGSAGGGAVYFETVEISATCKVTTLHSDIAIWRRPINADDNDICDECVIPPDIVEVVIRSQSFENITMLPSDVRIEKVRIDYIPMDSDTPSLASQELALGQFVKPDSEHTLSIEIINTDQKGTFPLNRVRKGEIDEDKTYTYSVKLSFSGIETATNKQQNFSTNLGLRVDDYLTLKADSNYFEENEPDCYPFNITIFPNSPLKSDVVLWEDTNNDGICDSLLPGEDDIVDFTIETQSYYNTDHNTEFEIEKVTIDYTCTDDYTPNDVASRELTSVEKPISQSLPPNGSVTVSRIIISSDQKNDPNSPLSTLKKGEKNYPETYIYDVDLTFSIRRVASDKLYNISSSVLKVEVSDRSNNETCTWP